MYIMIDNYDSFVHNLSIYMQELGHEVEMIRNDQVQLAYLESLFKSKALEGLILSPGPKSPAESGQCLEILRSFAGRVPILGVCLGHQIIGYAYGAVVKKGKRPMHGKVTSIIHEGEGIFTNLPTTYSVTRYHSLVVDEENWPEALCVTARAADGSVQGLQHREWPIYGVQFHPEAVLTEYGSELLHNFTLICDEWWKENTDENVG